jgi:hypothetical protein
MSGLLLSPLDFARYKEMSHGFDPWDISLFGRVACPELPHRFGGRNVPKYPTGYGRELSSHGRQIGRMAKRCFFRLLQESVTPCELVISAPLDASFTCQRRGAARGGDDVLVGTFARQFVGVATIMASELVATPVPNAAAIVSAARVGSRLPAGERIVT